MPITAQPEAVPLNIWVAEQAPTASGVRRGLAARIIEAYSSPGGVVLDFSPGRGEVLAAAASTGRGAVALRHPPGCAGRPRVPELDALHDSAELAVALPPASHLSPPRSHPLSAAAAAIVCRRAAPLLRPGGYLVVGTLGRAAGGRRDPVTGAVAAATGAGLRYYQHLVALLDADLVSGGVPAGGRRRLAHADLLVFTRSAR